MKRLLHREEIKHGTYAECATSDTIYTILIVDGTRYYTVEGSDWKMVDFLESDWYETPATLARARMKKLEELGI